MKSTRLTWMQRWRILTSGLSLKAYQLIIGETGSDASKPMAARVNHAGYTIGAAAKYGIVCFRWMDLLDRKNLVWKEPEILKIIMDNAPSK